jgi:large subunit ribosomal protein L21
MNFAIIETGGKQYKVSPGQKIRVEKLDGAEGDVISFGSVLLLGGDKPSIGMPNVAGAAVEAKILRQARDRKKTVFRYHSKTRYRKRKGHRQHFTELEITKI